MPRLTQLSLDQRLGEFSCTDFKVALSKLDVELDFQLSKSKKVKHQRKRWAQDELRKHAPVIFT